MKPGDEFFFQLLHESKIAFEASPIRTQQLKEGQRWNYSVCATPIQKGKGIILGINWGADRNGHEPQTTIPNGRDILSDNFIKRSRALLETTFCVNFETIDFNYANLCFFRTPTIRSLTNVDFSLSLPLFKKYVEYIKPKWIVSLGMTNFDILSRAGYLTEVARYPENESKFYAFKAQLWGFSIWFLPHPNARVKAHLRSELWNYAKYST